MHRPRPKVYYGWVVLAAISGISFANAVTSIGLLTVFIIPITQDFDWSRTQFSAATSVGAVLGAGLAPFTGRLSDRLGARLLLTAGAALIVLATVYLSLMQTLVGFYVAFSLARLADQGLVQNIGPSAVAKWFLRYRGRALAALFFMTSAGGVALPLLGHFVIEAWSWRIAWAVMAGVILTLGLVPAVLLVKREPEDARVDGEGRTEAEPEPVAASSLAAGEEVWRVSAAMKTRSLWFVLVAGFSWGFGSAGVALHLVPYLVEKDIGTGMAVGAVSVSFMAGGLGNLCWGLLGERYSPRRLLTLVYIIGAAGIAVLLAASSAGPAYVFAILRGASSGGIATVTTLLLADYYGRRHLGSIYGLSRSVQVAGFAVGPLVAGAVYDISDSYAGAFAAFLGLSVAAALLVAMAARPGRQRAPY